MTEQEIAKEREQVRAALQNKLHPLRNAVEIFYEAYLGTSPQGRRMMRSLAPYMFEGNDLVRVRVH